MPQAEPIRIAMSQRADGSDIARCDGHEIASRHGAEMALARVLMSAGYPDTSWRTERDGRVCLFGPSLHALARLTVSETDNRRVSILVWQPMLQKPVARAA